MQLGSSQLPVFTIFVFSTLYFFSGIFFGLDFSDSFFHLNNAVFRGSYSSSFFLSSTIIDAVYQVFGPELWKIRFFNACLIYSSFFLPFLINKERLKLKSLLLISVGVILFSPLNVNILGYDSLSIFILSLLFSVALRFQRKSTLLILLLLSVISALAAFIRVPNAIVIILLAILFFFTSNKKMSVSYMILSLVFILLGYYLVYGSFKSYVEALYTTEAHSLLKMLKGYFFDFVQLFGYFVIILAGYFLSRNILLKSRIASYILPILILALYFQFIGFSAYWKNYSLFLTATAMAWIFVEFKKKSTYLKRTILVTGAVFWFIIPFGSNTGLLKSGLMLVILPFLLNDFKISLKSYWLIIFFLLLPLAVSEKLYKTYEDDSILKLQKIEAIDKLRFIHTTPERKLFLKKVIAKADSLQKNDYDLAFYGDKSHIFKYLYPTSLNSLEFYQPEATFYEYTQSIQNASRIKLAIIEVQAYPENLWEGQVNIHVKNNCSL